MAKKRDFLWILLTLSAELSRTQSDLTCPVFGTDQSSSLTRSTLERVFLNFESPSQCRGNVTSYRYCFYDSAREEEPESFDYEAVLIVYRRSSPTSNIYTPVPGSIRELSLSHTEANRFRCLTEQVQRFEIYENDVVGACVKDQQFGGVDPLHLVGETSDNSVNFKTYRLDTSLLEHCTNTGIGTVDTERSDFTQQRNLILHLYANIDVTASCQVGSNPPATAPRTSNVEGTYLNTDNPVACATENTITSWHYCYYTSPLTAGQTYTITVAVWRLDTPTNTYRLTAGSARTITLVHVATLAKIFCLEETLGSAESVFVSGGDVIGVVLPSSNPIPVVSSDSSSNSSLMRHPQTTSPTNLPIDSSINAIPAALHLYSNLEFTPLAPGTTEASATAVTTEREHTQTIGTIREFATTTMQSSATTPDQIATTVGLIETTTVDEAIATTEADDTEVTTTKESSTNKTPAKVSETQTPTETGNQTLAFPEVATTIAGSSGQELGSAGVDSGDIAAIILSVVVMAFIVLTVVSFLIAYKQHKKKSLLLQQTGIGDNIMEMTRNQVFGVELEGNMLVTQNKAYGQFGENSNIEMTSNQVYGLRSENQGGGEENDHLYERITDVRYQEQELSYQFVV